MIQNVKDIIFDVIPGTKSPARYYWQHKIIVVNVPIWAKMNPDQRLFVLLHEVGHATLQTRDELKADAWALNEYLKLGGKLSQSLYALTNNLSEKDPEGYARIINQFNSLVKYDIEHNNNEKLNYIMNTPEHIESFELFPTMENNSDFLGLGKNARERREARQERREERHNANLAIKQARAERIRSGEKSFLDKGLDTVKNIFGAGSTDPGIDPKTYQAPEKPKNNNTLYIIVGIVIVGILIGAFIYFRKKK